MSKESAVNAVMNWRNRTKEKLVTYKGGQCEKCGYSNLNYLRVFEFHHKNPEEKDFTISGKSWGYETLKCEVDKCILVCSNCHKEIHEDLDREKRTLRSKKSRPAGWRSRKPKICATCGNETKDGRKFCSIACNAKHQEKLPSREELLILKQRFSNITIGKQFGVSEAAVRKKLKK